MGGTFDPVHNGHIYIAKKAMEEYKFDKMLFIPNGRPPHKSNVSAGDRERFEMLSLAIAGIPYFEIEDWEMKKGGASYTYETLSFLKEKYPNHTLYFIIGADNLSMLSSWRHPERICAQATILYFKRPMYEADKALLNELKTSLKCEIKTVKGAREQNISSTNIRKLIREKRPVMEYLPESVVDYIARNGIYS